MFSLAVLQGATRILWPACTDVQPEGVSMIMYTSGMHHSLLFFFLPFLSCLLFLTLSLCPVVLLTLSLCFFLLFLLISAFLQAQKQRSTHLHIYTVTYSTSTSVAQYARSAFLQYLSSVYDWVSGFAVVSSSHQLCIPSSNYSSYGLTVVPTRVTMY